MANDHIADDRKKVRLIDANAAIKAMNAVDIHFWEDAEDGVEMCVNILHNAPTVDAVPVVRCKDCEYCGHFDGLLYCDNSRGLAGSVSPEGFCSYGERRTEDG